MPNSRISVGKVMFMAVSATTPAKAIIPAEIIAVTSLGVNCLSFCIYVTSKVMYNNYLK